jgi:hypothetical protein
MSFGDSQQ